VAAFITDELKTEAIPAKTVCLIKLLLLAIDYCD
jgi:hypothetical protein